MWTIRFRQNLLRLRDTRFWENYLRSVESTLAVPHCFGGSMGWGTRESTGSSAQQWKSLFGQSEDPVGSKLLPWISAHSTTDAAMLGDLSMATSQD